MKLINSIFERSKIFFLCMLPVFFMTGMLRIQQLENGGYRIIRRVVGMGDLEKFDMIDKISFFYQDFLILTVLLIALSIISIKFKLKKFIGLLLVINIALLVLMYVNLQSYGSVGRYISIEAFIDSAAWATDNPQSISDYINISSFLKFIALIIFSFIIHIFAIKYYPRVNLKNGFLENFSNITFGILLLVFFSAGAMVFCYSKIPHTKSNLIAMGSQLFGDSLWNEGVYAGMNMDQLLSTETSKKLKPICTNESSFKGSAKDFDIVIFSMETLPSNILNLTESMADMPVLQQILKNSIVATNHFSTFPYTSYALFSAYTSIYPTRRLEKSFERSALENNGSFKLPGFLRVLSENGYSLSAHFPLNHSFDFDRDLYSRVAPIQQTVSISADIKLGEEPSLYWKKIMDKDRVALDTMKSTIMENIKQKKRYASIYLPQMGHAPWYDVKGQGDHLGARGREIIKIQDKWLGEIIDLLKQQGRYDNTIILFYGDHGIRTRNEDPKFKAGMIDSYSFSVPFLIHSPSILSNTRLIKKLTSHVDISPTLLDLLGLDRDEKFEQGTSMFCTSSEERIVPFYADWYLGADGFYDGKQFCMINHITSSSYCNSTLSFNAKDMVVNDKLHDKIKSTVDDLKQYQERYFFNSVVH